MPQLRAEARRIRAGNAALALINVTNGASEREILRALIARLRRRTTPRRLRPLRPHFRSAPKTIMVDAACDKPGQDDLS